MLADAARRQGWRVEEVKNGLIFIPPDPNRESVTWCADPADVDATYARATEAGFEGKTAPWDAFWGQRFAYLRDPDGNIVALYAPLE